jgi:hypothetical protein
MNGTTTAARSVQLAVMAAPSVSVAEAVAEARRRHDPHGGRISRPTARLALSPQAAH